MKGINPTDVPFHLERILSGLDPMREPWFVGNPCCNGHGVDGRNVRYHGRRSCVACNLDKTHRREGSPKVVCSGCQKLMRIKKPMCQECINKSRNDNCTDMNWIDEKNWDCFIAAKYFFAFPRVAA